MQIIVHDSMKLTELQELFSMHFLYLRLEFFNYNAASTMGSTKKQLALWDKTLSDIRVKHKCSHLYINSHESVNTLKKCCLLDFGILVQVFRKSDNSWLEIQDTDEQTLSEQNKVGEGQSYNWQKPAERTSTSISGNSTNPSKK
jgi:hypothetical protein